MPFKGIVLYSCLTVLTQAVWVTALAAHDIALYLHSGGKACWGQEEGKQVCMQLEEHRGLCRVLFAIT